MRLRKHACCGMLTRVRTLKSRVRVAGNHGWEYVRAIARVGFFVVFFSFHAIYLSNTVISGKTPRFFKALVVMNLLELLVGCLIIGLPMCMPLKTR